jgi:hypothetical protein
VKEKSLYLEYNQRIMKKIYLVTVFIAAFASAQPGSSCSEPIVIGSLPFTTSDDTANYPDWIDPQTTTHPSCATTTFGNYYHGGNDVIYAYTAGSSGTIKVEIPAAIGWTGLFIYNDCADIGIAYAACATSTSDGPRTINNFAVTAGQTYYIFISSWPAPQTVAYTLNVTQLTLGLEDVAAESGIVVYPNPVKDRLFVRSGVALSSASVINASGQRVAAMLTGDEIVVENLTPGFYIVELKTDDGTAVRRRFVKSK